MKKFLSFALAFLMLASMTISISARGIFSSSASAETFGYSSNYSDLMNLLRERNYKEYLNIINATDSANVRFDKCPKCGGTAVYRVEGFEVVWTCLEKDCDGKGTTDVTVSNPDSSSYHVKRCSDCGKYQLVYYIKDGKICWYCFGCEKGNISKPDTSVFPIYPEYPVYPWYPEYPDYPVYPWYPEYPDYPVYPIYPEHPIYPSYPTYPDYDGYRVCSECGKKSALYLYNAYGTYYWHCYSCGKGNVSESFFNKYWHLDYLYTVKVSCSIGGTYSITNTTKAHYGEAKTITFTPYAGYVLKEVYVDGKSVGYIPELTLTVTEDTSVSAYFVRADKYAEYNLKASSSGKGTITATLNGKTVDPASINARYYDQIKYNFVPASKNYYVAAVRLDKQYLGQMNSYSFNTIFGDHTLSVEFKWNSPYLDDISDSYLNAVEYVTEAGIMGELEEKQFVGTAKAKVGAFVAALAEMADTNNALSTDTARLTWAVNNGIIDVKEDTEATLTVKKACDIVKAYLLKIEDINGISFKKVDRNASAKDLAVAISMVSEKTYDTNRNLNRYDIASVCYLLATLAY